MASVAGPSSVTPPHLNASTGCESGGACRWRRTSVTLALIWSVLAPAAVSAQYPPALQYQRRGDRYEGLRSTPVGGLDVELLSARIRGRSPDSGWPDELILRFFLPRGEQPHIIVRQLRPTSFHYWLDRVSPSTPWREGRMNEYRWATGPVLSELGSLTRNDLGTVVRLGQRTGSRRERVVPAIFSAIRPGDLEYRFTFKTNGVANLTIKIYRGDSPVPVYERPQNREAANSPFTLGWRALDQPEGWYRLVVEGYFLDNSPLDKQVEFYHRPSPPGEVDGR